MSYATLLDSEELQRRDIVDRDLQSQARRAGHTQPRSTGSAAGQEGRRTGTVAI